jgi:dihydrodipicolinate synthase/N-acetylneuraminate lyase
MVLSGIITAALTPLSNDGETLAENEIFERYYKFLLERKINGLLICGTTGEGPILSIEERKQVAGIAVSTVANQIPVIIHAGCNSTIETIELARHAKLINADGIAVISPYFYTYDSLAQFNHFRRVADSVPGLPVYLYYLPSFTHNDITPALIPRLFEACPNIVGIKHSDDDRIRLQEYRQVAGEDFCILSGDDAIALPALSIGVNGCVTGKSSTFPEMMVAIYQSFKSGDLTKARKLQSNLNKLLGGLLDTGIGIGIAYFKSALRYRGLDIGGVRSPQRALTKDEERILFSGLDELKTISNPPDTWLLPD